MTRHATQTKKGGSRTRAHAPVMELQLPPGPLDADMEAYFGKCMEKLGFVPNVLQAYRFDLAKLKAFVAMADDLMLAKSALSKLEREMIAVVVSSANFCHYCIVAHGAAVRKMSGDAKLGDILVANFREANLDARTRAMLEFVWKLTLEPWLVGEEDRAKLRKAGFKDRHIWDIASVAGFFAMSNRIASATGMKPNEEYYAMAR